MQAEIALQRILREILDDDALTVCADTDLNTIAGFDSVAKVKVVLALEEQFDIRFTTDEVAEAHTAGDFLQAVARHAG